MLLTETADRTAQTVSGILKEKNDLGLWEEQSDGPIPSITTTDMAGKTKPDSKDQTHAAKVLLSHLI